ncbi:MAG: MFS transporter [Chloroflexota bacterium]|nr:MAG: MFS transporter [Chloroflexota bacterium]
MTAAVAAWHPSRLAIGSWILYDLANTIFSMNIVSLYFSLWVVRDMGARDSDYGLASSASQAVLLVTAPFLGALSDQVPRRMPLLVVTTILCCAATFLLGTWGLAASLILFGVANYFYQAGLIFYDTLLPSVSDDSNRGRIGGFGVGIGYFGSFVGVGMGLAILGSDPGAKPLIFKLTGALFLLLAIPCFLWVRERPRAVALRGLASARAAFADLTTSIRHVNRYPGLARFLIGRVFYADAATTIIIFMGIYVTQEIGYTETRAQLVLLVGIAAAVVGGIVWGFVVDRIGPRRAIAYVMLTWAFCLSGAVAIPLLQLPTSLFWLVASLAGVALGGTWTADRPLLMRLAPPDHLGQYYGLYAMVGRFAAILGPLLWAAIVDWLGLGRPAAVASLLVMVAIGYLILRPIDDRVGPLGRGHVASALP